MSAVWTDERTTLLRELWGNGESASRIARRLGGVSRNAVIGKVFRLGLPRRHTATRDLPTRRPKRPPAPRKLVVPKAKWTPEPPRPEPLAPLDPTLGVLRLSTFACRYPIGDPAQPGFAFCGRTCDEEKAYCCDHARICYVPSKPLQPRQRSIRPTWREGWEIAA